MISQLLGFSVGHHTWPSAAFLDSPAPPAGPSHISHLSRQFLTDSATEQSDQVNSSVELKGFPFSGGSTLCQANNKLQLVQTQEETALLSGMTGWLMGTSERTQNDASCPSLATDWLLVISESPSLLALRFPRI